MTWGIQRSYRDWNGSKRDASEKVIDAIMASMGAAPGSMPPEPTTYVLAPGSELPERNLVIGLEEGSELNASSHLPPDMPLGYHRCQSEDRSFDLICTPTKCYLPPELSIWGWALQLYALRSASSWGIGDLGDLRDFLEWSTSLGAGAVMINPLAAVAPVVPQQASPYFPSSRLFRNPLYLRIEGVPGAHAIDLEPVMAAGRKLNQSSVIDRDEIFRLKMNALEQIWNKTRPKLENTGDSLLEEFATFNALAEVHGPNWRDWASDLRRPGPASERFAASHRDRVEFHKWIQRLIDSQLDTMSKNLLVFDLPVGVDPGGADAWMWQETLAGGITVGAPPDEFNRAGQDWGLPPFDPWKLRNSGYRPFVETIRAGFRAAAGLRIDHIMGLFRLYWIPGGFGPAEGAYVRYPFEDLLGIVALESARAGTWVVGEDLGTVEDEVRTEMRKRNILGQKVLWFEEGPPSKYGREFMASVTTHDLPTILGVWSGEDSAPSLRSKIDGATEEEVVLATYRRLATARSMLLMASVDDAALSRRRPNMPGTHTERPNWSIPLPLSLEELRASHVAQAIATALSR